jgi:hypothetical protein
MVATYRERGGDLLGRHCERPGMDHGFEEWGGANGRIWCFCARYGVAVKLVMFAKLECSCQGGTCRDG